MYVADDPLDELTASFYQLGVLFATVVHRAHSGHSHLLLLVSCLGKLMDQLTSSFIVIEKRELTVSVAFTSVSLFTMLRMPLNVLPTFVRSYLHILFPLTPDCHDPQRARLAQAHR